MGAITWRVVLLVSFILLAGCGFQRRAGFLNCGDYQRPTGPAVQEICGALTLNINKEINAMITKGVR